VRLAEDRLVCVRLGQVMRGYVRLGRLVNDMPGSDILGQVRPV